VFQTAVLWLGTGHNQFVTKMSWEKHTPPCNLAKFVLDALKGVIFANDKQVTKTIELKVWDLDAPHDGQTIISLKEIKVQTNSQQMFMKF
jgi:hypothetical protein